MVPMLAAILESGKTFLVVVPLISLLENWKLLELKMVNSNYFPFSSLAFFFIPFSFSFYYFETKD